MDMVSFRLTGMSPLMVHNPHRMAPGGSDGKLGVKRIPTPEDEAAAAAYRNGQGEFVHPTEAVRNAGLTACKGRKIAPRVWAAGAFRAGIFVVEPYCVLLDPDSGEPLDSYTVDVRRVVIQRSGIIRGRPRFDRWATVVTFEHDSDMIPLPIVGELLALAGKVVGIGEYRVEKGGPFGRFRVEEA
jgi:hypothetical protein